MRISEDQVHSQVDDIDLLVSFDAETIFRHSDRLIEGGAIIYDSSITNITLDEDTYNRLPSIYKNFQIFVRF